VAAFLFPFTGIWRGIRSIGSASRFAPNKLEEAVRAGALCVVARCDDWQTQAETTEKAETTEVPFAQERIRVIRENYARGQCEEAHRSGLLDVVEIDNVRIHGQHHLPRQYCLVRLPQDAKVVHQPGISIEVSCTEAGPKSFIALVQLIFSSIVLYRAAQSVEIQRYGYASYSLSVLPYTLVSILNLAGSLISHEYPTLYMVRSHVMEEAIKDGGIFDGTIGVLCEAERIEVPRMGKLVSQNEVGILRDVVRFLTGMSCGSRSGTTTAHVRAPAMGFYQIRQLSKLERMLSVSTAFLTFLVVFAPYCIIGALTRFELQSSTFMQRFWMMSWLVVGQFAGALMAFIMNAIKSQGGRIVILLSAFPLFIPAVGGLITVRNMMVELGKCSGT
jgi:hypothetical protein